MNRIQELEAEIQRIKKEEADKKKAMYQHFVGKYVHRAHTSYEKIIGIDRINTDEFGDEVVFDSIHVYYDNRGDIIMMRVSICKAGDKPMPKNLKNN